MLSARRAPRACASCTYRLQSLFEHGFTRPSPLRIPRTASLVTRSRKAFSTTRLLRDDASTSSTKANEPTIAPKTNVEATTDAATEAVPNIATEAEATVLATVRSARQTFGETLPKDFLTDAEYRVYERLYGPPTRHTTFEDIDVETLNSEEVSRPRVQNVMLRKDASGEYEEVEMDAEYSGEGLSEEIEATGEGLTAEQRAEMRKTEEELLAQMMKNIGMEGEAADIVSGDLEEEVSKNVGKIDVEEQQRFIEEQEKLRGAEIQGNSERELAAIRQLHAGMEAAMKQANEELLAEEEEDFDAITGEKAYQQEHDVEESEQDETATYSAQDNWRDGVKELYESEENWGEDEYDGSLGGDMARSHPYTREGRSGTTPSTIFLPAETFSDPLNELLKRSDIKHLTAAAEKAFGGRGLPHSASTPGSEAMKQLPQKHIGLEPSQNRMSEIEADAYMAVVMPSVYATVMSGLVEMRKRLGAKWLREMLLREDGKGPSILDAGAGGAGALAWKDIMQAEWDVMAEEGLIDKEKQPHPPAKLSVLCTPLTLRHRVATLLEDTTLLHKLPDYIHSSNGEAALDGSTPFNRKSFDVVIAPHGLLPLPEEWQRKNKIQNLWALTKDNGGILLLMEKGLPRGFEAIAHARSMLLAKHIASPGSTHIINNNLNNDDPDIPKEKGMIVAPCTNHDTCPMYPVEGFSAGRKDFCHFNQRYIRPSFYQRVIGASHRNHEDVKYSYLAIRRGVDSRNTAADVDPSTSLVQGKVATDAAFKGHEAGSDSEKSYHDQVPAEGFSTLSLPRVINEPLKRRGHVSMDVCTPSGTLERWTVPKSFSAQAYRDSRKTRWGDLWALGAKTRVERTPRLGKPADKAKEIMRAAKKKGQWKGRDISEAEKKKRAGKDNFEIAMGEDGPEDIKHITKGLANDRSERRNKGGRIVREKKIKFDKREKKDRRDEDDDIY